MTTKLKSGNKTSADK